MRMETLIYLKKKLAMIWSLSQMICINEVIYLFNFFTDYAKDLNGWCQDLKSDDSNSAQILYKRELAIWLWIIGLCIFIKTRWLFFATWGDFKQEKTIGSSALTSFDDFFELTFKYCGWPFFYQEIMCGDQIQGRNFNLYFLLF